MNFHGSGGSGAPGVVQVLKNNAYYLWRIISWIRKEIVCFSGRKMVKEPPGHTPTGDQLSARRLPRSRRRWVAGRRGEVGEVAPGLTRCAQTRTLVRLINEVKIGEPNFLGELSANDAFLHELTFKWNFSAQKLLKRWNMWNEKNATNWQLVGKYRRDNYRLPHLDFRDF